MNTVPGTLGWYFAQPVFTPLDFRGLAYPKVLKTVRGTVASLRASAGNADDFAAEFYLMVHGLGELREKFGLLEPLSPKVIEALDVAMERLVTDLYPRMLSYLTVICLKEARHGKDPINELEEYFSLCGGGSMYTKAPDLAVGTVVSGLVDYFNRPIWSTSYGGPKWAAIAKCLRGFLRGEISAVMMLDTAFTLAHNTGPIFNKGHVFSGNGGILEVLDVQRAGMIPAWITSKAIHLLPLWARWSELLGWGEKEVDWLSVNKYGVGDYTNYIPQDVLEAKKAEESKAYFEIGPLGIKVLNVERV